MRYTSIVVAMMLACAWAACPGPRAPRRAAPAASGRREPASDVIQTAAQGMLERARQGSRGLPEATPSKVNALVNKYLLPHFDTEFAAQLVLGQHWRTATPEQRKRFIDAFYKSLLNNYGAALSDFTADRLKIFPTTVDANAPRATVRTEVKRASGDRVAVNYYMRKTAEGWKAWDVVIDGISYVNSYREDFSPRSSRRAWTR